VGHSNRPQPAFLDVLRAYRIELVADVRRFPGSRKHPQYQQPSLESSLQEAGIGYTWLPALGGRRRATADAPDNGWRHPAFRAYAAYTSGEEFAEGFAQLVTLAQGLRTAIMCAEILWWRCHRRIVADALVSVGAPVVHIRDSKTSSVHALKPPARLVEGVLTYRSE
jgi:uncharacterized protein (DUF488 family)